MLSSFEIIRVGTALTLVRPHFSSCSTPVAILCTSAHRGVYFARRSQFNISIDRYYMWWYYSLPHSSIEGDGNLKLISKLAGRIYWKYYDLSMPASALRFRERTVAHTGHECYVSHQAAVDIFLSVIVNDIYGTGVSRSCTSAVQ